MPLTAESREKIFRKAAGTAIENSHGAIKQVWVALFAGGTFAFINSFDTMMGCSGVPLFSSHPDRCPSFIDGNSHWWNFVLVASLYVVYVLTFYRFYVGNIRVFDMRYVEIVKFVASVAEVQKPAENRDDYLRLFDYVDTNRRWESIYLIFKTLVIISLTIDVNAPETFLSIYLLVLVMDVFWIFVLAKRPRPYNYLDLFAEKLELPTDPANQPEGRRQGVEDLRRMFPTDALAYWKMNNLICFVLLFVTLVPVWIAKFCPQNCLVAHLIWYYAAGAVVALGNCAFDFYGTWWFYNPRFKRVYELFANDAAPRC
jgi:hypothetical protein